MSFDTNTHCDHLNNGHAATCRPMPGWREAMGPEAEPLGQGVPRQEPGNEKGTGRASGTHKAQSAGKVNEAADERAFRLRSAGYTYRQIGDVMGVDASMAHRRVKRHALRQKMYRDEKLEEAREFELEKLRLMEKAILPEATDGDHRSIKLVLRIMELRRKILKDVPLEIGDRIEPIEERAELLAEVVNEESQRLGSTDDSDWSEEDDERCWAELVKELRISNKEQSNVEVKESRNGTGGQAAGGTEEVGGTRSADVDAKAVELFSRLFTEATRAMRQETAEQGVATNGGASTKGSTEGARTGGGGTEAEGTEAQSKGEPAHRVWHGY